MKDTATRHFVLDASVALAWCFKDERTPYTAAILAALTEDGATALVAPIWPREVANTLLVAERRSRITHAEATQFLSLLSCLPISLTEPSPGDVFDFGFERARQWSLTAYDAAYLDLALREAVPLVTLDAALRRAAEAAGVAVEAA
jgi:predicted nucleic acid-binding protein